MGVYGVRRRLDMPPGAPEVASSFKPLWQIYGFVQFLSARGLLRAKGQISNNLDQAFPSSRTNDHGI